MNDPGKIHVGHNPIREYDAHIYYSPQDRSMAAHLREVLQEKFPLDTVQIGPLFDRPIGPHPIPMFEVNFLKKHYQEISGWLDSNRGNLSVLIHEVTGNDPRDHTSGALWLGEPLKLDESKLDPAPVDSK